MTDSFDLVVIGAGTAGTGVARRCRKAGWTVAIADELPYGGTCALRGCDPKKVLVGAADALDWVRRMDGRGINGSVGMSWPDLQRFKRTFTDPVPQRTEEGLRQAGIHTYHGRADFVATTAVQVGNDVLEARHVLVATGAKPAPQSYPGAEHLTMSDRFLELETLPSRIAFVGGGYISFEFAHVAARAGAHVTVIHRGSRPLEHFDPDLVGVLLERTRAIGIDVQLAAEVTAIAPVRGAFAVRARDRQDGGELEFEADLVVHGAGRVAAASDLQLDRAGVAWDERGVRVNEYLQSISNPAVYAAGDASASGPPLTPVASREAEVAAANLLEGNHQKIDYSAIPSVVFTIPALAAVGVTEEQASHQQKRFRVQHARTSTWYTARRVAEDAYGYKTLIEEETDRILGAHLVGPHAEEVINVFALAIRRGLTVEEVKDVILAYPTAGSDIPHML